MDDEQITQPTPEELAEEQAAAALPKEEEIRAKVIEEFGFDEDADAERIDKLTKERLTNAEKLSKAIGQKVKHRTAAQELSKKVPAAKPEVVAPSAPQPLTPKEQYALTQANVHIDDLDEVLEYAKFKKIDVATALNDSVLKGILAQKSEERASAAATATGPAPRGPQTTTDQDVLRQAQETGEVPDTDEGMQALFRGKQSARTSKRR